MLQLLDQFKELDKSTGFNLDMVDIGCTLTNAMTGEEIEDLSAMIKFLKNKTEMSDGEVLSNALHDINGFKDKYFKVPGSECFSPHSHNYKKKTA